MFTGPEVLPVRLPLLWLTHSQASPSFRRWSESGFSGNISNNTVTHSKCWHCCVCVHGEIILSENLHCFSFSQIRFSKVKSMYPGLEGHWTLRGASTLCNTYPYLTFIISLPTHLRVYLEMRTGKCST